MKRKIGHVSSVVNLSAIVAVERSGYSVYLAKNGPIMSVLHKLDAHLYVLTVTVMTIFSLNLPLSMIINKTDKYT